MGVRSWVIGITGGLACGKSEVGKIFEDEGWAVCDTDQLARDLLKSGNTEFKQVIRAFGSEMVGPDGEVDRQILGNRIFKNSDDRNALNAILHPPILRKVQKWLQKQALNKQKAAVIIPLLYEIDATKGWDAILCVAASEEVVMERLKKRGLSEQESRERLAAQWSLAEKIKRADYVIHNDGSRSELMQETKKICAQILRKES